jgi:hypothetical protein
MIPQQNGCVRRRITLTGSQDWSTLEEGVESQHTKKNKTGHMTGQRLERVRVQTKRVGLLTELLNVRRKGRDRAYQEEWNWSHDWSTFGESVKGRQT